MAEQYNIADAGLDDGTIDFYTLVQESPDADSETLRAKIQSLYNEAQANRDHRNLTRRREYQTLLDWLPRAKAALLEPEKRARYNAYLASVQIGTAEIDFDDFMNDLLGHTETMEPKTGLLGVQDKNQPPRARTLKTPAETSKPSAPKIPTSASPAPPIAAIVGALIALVVGFVIANSLLNNPLPAILVALILGAITFVLLNPKPRGGIRS